MNIQTSFTALPKYFEEFHNYFDNADEKLVSYNYIPEYLEKTISKKTKNSCKNDLNKNFKI